MTRGQRPSLKLVVRWMIALLITLGSITLQQGYAQGKESKTCSLATLNGVYVFDATGFNIINGVAVPKTVVNFLTFKGDGSLTSIATAVVGGNKVADDTPGTGSYIVNADCTGNLTDARGFTFDLFIAPHGRSFHMIQTVTGQMLAGGAQRVKD
jgi:hypothetical protein